MRRSRATVTISLIVSRVPLERLNSKLPRTPRGR